MNRLSDMGGLDFGGCSLRTTIVALSDRKEETRVPRGGFNEMQGRKKQLAKRTSALKKPALKMFLFCVLQALNRGLVMVNFYSLFLTCQEKATVEDAVGAFCRIRP
jgi:hypothetical protein